MDFADLGPFQIFLGLGTLAAIVSIGAGIGDRFERRRRDLDRVSIISWRLVSTTFLMIAIVSFSVSLRSLTRSA